MSDRENEIRMANDKLPEGWVNAKISQIIASDGLFSDGDWVESKDQDPNGSIRLLQLADVGDGRFIDKSSRFVNEEKFEKLRCTEVFENDVLIARMPDPLGRACLTPKLKQKSITVVDVAIVRPGSESVSPVWLMHWINSPEIRQLMELESTGSTRKRIARGKIGEIVLPIPPLPEQKRIADKLEAVLGRVDACRARLDRVPALLKRFRQSVLAAATSGKLTEDWREENGVEEEWETATTDDLFEFVTSGSRGWAAHYSDTGASFLRVGNLNHDDIRLDLREIQHVSPPSGAEGRRTLVRPNDILISITADVGMVGLVPDGLGEAYINQHVALARPVAVNDARFLAWVLASKPAKDQWKAMQRGATKVGLSLGDIRAVEIGLPTLPEQTEIVRRVEALFALADRIEARLTAAQKTVERLTPATLAKAFRGELVPQDPNDEPAAVLLERIAGIKDLAPVKKARAKRPPRA